jgi:hypothetical protein
MRKAKGKRHEEAAVAEEAVAQATAAPATVKVRVTRQALNEGGFREPGSVFEISANRRAALGTLVEDVRQ